MKKLVNYTFEEFWKNNECVAKRSPMRSHYGSKNPIERFVFNKKKQYIKRILDKLKSKTLLDVGCGDGGLCSIISENIKYTGVDISSTQLRYAKSRKRRNIKFTLGDACSLQFKDNSFDIAICTDVIEHVLYPRKLISELKRVVKPEGYIIITFPNEKLWEIARLFLLRFPLRSPDHIYSIVLSDMRDNFKKIIKLFYIPLNTGFWSSLATLVWIKNQ